MKRRYKFMWACKNTFGCVIKKLLHVKTCWCKNFIHACMHKSSIYFLLSLDNERSTRNLI